MLINTFKGSDGDNGYLEVTRSGDTIKASLVYDNLPGVEDEGGYFVFWGAAELLLGKESAFEEAEPDPVIFLDVSSEFQNGKSLSLSYSCSTDSFFSSIDYKAKVVAFDKAATFNGWKGNDIVFGSSKADVLKGATGDDRINGRFGNDTLYGGKGKDNFIFDTKLSTKNVDTIKDFKHFGDTILLDDDIFDEVRKQDDLFPGAKTALSDSAFRANNSGKAQDWSDRIIYDKTDGHLYYDGNGNKDGGRVLFADLDAHLKIDASDFLLIT